MCMTAWLSCDGLFLQQKSIRANLLNVGFTLYMHATKQLSLFCRHLPSENCSISIPKKMVIKRLDQPSLSSFQFSNALAT
jgi:hypothetical protein